MRVLLENTTFLLHKIVRIAGIIRVEGIIRGRALYEEIRYVSLTNRWVYSDQKSIVELILGSFDELYHDAQVWMSSLDIVWDSYAQVHSRS